jgi:S1-C subfamily serine protease
MRRCTKCGYENDDGDKKCIACGEKLVDTEKSADTGGQKVPVDVEKAMKSVVEICSVQEKGYNDLKGSGFILNGGYVVTNAHVIGNHYSRITAKFEQRLDNEIYELEPVSVQPDADIAILKFIGLAKHEISARENLSLKEYDLRYGQFVYTIGNILGVGISLSDGIVSCPKQKNRKYLSVEELIQTNIPINHGNSGGALFDEHNNVVGMITCFWGELEWGICMAIPAKYISKELEKIILKR